MSVIKKDEIKREYVIGSRKSIIPADVRHEKTFMDAKFHDNRKLNLKNQPTNIISNNILQMVAELTNSGHLYQHLEI